MLFCSRQYASCTKMYCWQIHLPRTCLEKSCKCNVYSYDAGVSCSLATAKFWARRLCSPCNAWRSYLQTSQWMSVLMYNCFWGLNHKRACLLVNTNQMTAAAVPASRQSCLLKSCDMHALMVYLVNLTQSSLWRHAVKYHKTSLGRWGNWYDQCINLRHGTRCKCSVASSRNQ